MKHAAQRCLLILLFGSSVLAAAPKAVDDADISKIENKVVAHLKSYYETHTVDGVPSSARPSHVEIDIDSTERVQGWTGRCRTNGTATITTASKYAENYACTFEVISEIDDKKVVHIIETHSKRKE
jgi:hypothetical protein